MMKGAKAMSMKDRFDALKYGEGLSLNHMDPVSLEITIPIDPARQALSWQGGNPYLPEGIAWPYINDEPCNFYTQIYCPDLPPGIWGGLGPKTGWLSFFCSPKNFGDVKILHTESLGSERPAPVPPNHYDGYGSARPAYNKTIGDNSNLAPKWPVTIKEIHDLDFLNPHKLPELEKIRYREQRACIGKNMKAEHYLPFNQVIFEKMISLFQTYIDEETSGETQVKFLKYKNLDWAPYYRARVDTKQAFELVKSNIENDLAIQGFNQQLAIKFLDEISHIQTTNWWPEHGKNKHASLVAASKPLHNYFEFLELYLRMSYTHDKSAIPMAYLKPWEAYWRHAVKPELGQCGGAISSFYAVEQSAIRLLELPCSTLMGWNFGHVNRFGFFITPSELEARNWDAAFGDILN